LAQAALKLGRSGLPPGVMPSDTWIVGARDVGAESEAALLKLAAVWPGLMSPTIDVVVLLSTPKTVQGGAHRVEIVFAGGSSVPIELPPRVKFWREGRTGKDAVFLALLRIGLDADGMVEVISGYAHPVVGCDFLCPADSDQECSLIRAAKTLQDDEPPSSTARLVIVKPIFARLFGARKLTVDLLIFIQCGQHQQLLVTLEHLGFHVSVYIDGKIRDKAHIELSVPFHVFTCGPKFPKHVMEMVGAVRLTAIRQVLKKLLFEPELF
jgi:hypothetical protein